jgi:hypothetical protein
MQCLRLAWQRLLAHVLAGCIMLAEGFTRVDGMPTGVPPAVRASLDDVTSAVHQVGAIKRQVQGYDKCMQRLKYALAPMPHFACEHLHLPARAMHYIVKGIRSVDLDKVTEWRKQAVGWMEGMTSEVEHGNGEDEWDDGQGMQGLQQAAHSFDLSGSEFSPTSHDFFSRVCGTWDQNNKPLLGL